MWSQSELFSCLCFIGCVHSLAHFSQPSEVQKKGLRYGISSCINSGPLRNLSLQSQNGFEVDISRPFKLRCNGTVAYMNFLLFTGNHISISYSQKSFEPLEKKLLSLIIGLKTCTPLPQHHRPSLRPGKVTRGEGELRRSLYSRTCSKDHLYMNTTCL